MAIYNWQKDDWPDFRYSLEGIELELMHFSAKTGSVSGMLQALPEAMQMDAMIELMVAEAVKTSEIEGEYLDRRDVMSSIKNNLGLNHQHEPVGNKQAEGIGELMVDVRRTHQDSLTEDKLFEWHRMLFRADQHIAAGKWRSHTEPMQVVSGAMGKQRVHFEAPPSARVPEEMRRFILWFNKTAPGGSSAIQIAPVRAAVAHLYFETIHPFEDGNGRIGRAIAEKALAQGLGRPVVMSLSKTIEAKKNEYYEALQEAQTSNEISAWVRYFVRVVLAAQTEAEGLIQFTLRKARFFERFRDQLTERQLVVIQRMLKEGPNGFQGGMNARKYASITKASKATATRDLHDLLNKEVVLIIGAGRSTRYQLNL